MRNALTKQGGVLEKWGISLQKYFEDKYPGEVPYESWVHAIVDRDGFKKDKNIWDRDVDELRTWVKWSENWNSYQKLDWNYFRTEESAYVCSREVTAEDGFLFLNFNPVIYFHGKVYGASAELEYTKKPIRFNVLHEKTRLYVNQKTTLFPSTTHLLCEGYNYPSEIDKEFAYPDRYTAQCYIEIKLQKPASGWVGVNKSYFYKIWYVFKENPENPAITGPHFDVENGQMNRNIFDDIMSLHPRTKSYDYWTKELLEDLNTLELWNSTTRRQIYTLIFRTTCEGSVLWYDDDVSNEYPDTNPLVAKRDHRLEMEVYSAKIYNGG